MKCVKIVLSCLCLARTESSLPSQLGSPKKTRKLSTILPDSMMMRTITDALQPAEPVAIIPDVKCYIDCSLLCAKHRHCVSSSYIRELKLCLLSSATLKKFDVAVWDKTLLHSVYTQLINEDGFTSSKMKSVNHGQPPPLCGMNAFSIVNSRYRWKRIVDGYTPEPYHMPWVGLLVKDDRARCTTTLVSKNPNVKASVWVLSAKHCFNDVLLDEYEDKKINSSSYGLLFGVHDLQFSTQHVIHRTIDEVFIYPDEGVEIKDIILIKLARPVKFNSYINGLCLPNSPDENMLYEDTSCTTCGFGATKVFSRPIVSSNVLQCIKIVVRVPNADRSLYNWKAILKVKAPAFGPYHGDSGRPVSCHTVDPWSFLFVSSVTAGQSSLFKSPFLIGTRISYFMNFIDDSMHPNIAVDAMCCPS